jgi:hypothetical protein
MSDPDEAREWFDKAEEDFEGAASLEPALKEACETLAPYAVLYRYPGRAAEADEAKAAMAAAREVRRFVRGHLPFVLQ